jgi:hypothetical protein
VTVLALVHASRRYPDGVTALDDVSLSVAPRDGWVEGEVRR